MPHPIPDIPGDKVQPDPQMVEWFYQLCGVADRGRSPPFPGAQPVSFSRESLSMLEEMDFWVCEKSDGVRLLIFINVNPHTRQQETWLIDRKKDFYFIEGLHFPHWDAAKRQGPDRLLSNTVLDGELVIDIDPATGEQTTRFYAFDCLVVDGRNLMPDIIVSRYGKLKEWVVKPFERALQMNPDLRQSLPFELVAKDQKKAYYVEDVLRVDIPALHHGHDGLIFTCAESSYTVGTDQRILKWKPADENSIDFRLQLRFPPSKRDSRQPDLGAKPAFLLEKWKGGDEYTFFDLMDVSDEQWEEIKESGEQWDGRIVEVCWDKTRETWSFMRFRDDKRDGNHASIVEKIINSIRDGVELEALFARKGAMRAGWAAREAAKKHQVAPQPHAQQQQQQHQQHYQQHQSQAQGHRGAGAGAPVGLRR